jgi:hypothetical protein
VKWTERSSAAKMLLDGRPTPAGLPLDRQNDAVLREIDTILAEGAGSTAIQHKPSLSQQLLSGNSVPSSSAGTHSHSASSPRTSSNSRYGCGSNNDIFDMEKPIALPLSHPAHQLQASQTFGVAATKEILLARSESAKTANLSDLEDWTRRGIENGVVRQNTQRQLLDISDLASIQDGHQGMFASNPHEALPATDPLAGNFRSDIQPAAASYDDASGRPNGAGLFGVPASSDTQVLPAGVSETEAFAATKERIELATKYLYITTLLEKMTASAQLSYQMALQMESLRKRLKPKRTRGLSQDVIDQMRLQYNQQKRILGDSRELFLKSRLTLQWFYRDFDLNYGLHLLSDAELVTVAEKERLASMPVDPDNQGVTWAHTEHPLDATLAGIESRRTGLELRLNANERYALSIAHYYLSKHSRGNGLSMQDAPDFDLALFQMLDTTHSQVISREQLHMGIHRLAEAVDSLNARIRALQMHNETMNETAATGGQYQNVISSNATKIARLQAELAPIRSQLQQLYSYFLNVFTRNIFVNLDASDLHGARLEAEDIDARGLRSDIANISSSGALPVNPLDLANDGVVGPDEIVPQAHVGTGLAVEREANTVSEQPQVKIVRETGLFASPAIGFGNGLEFQGAPQSATGTIAVNQPAVAYGEELPVDVAAHQAWNPQPPAAESSQAQLNALLSRARKPLPAQPVQRAAQAPQVATNAALAPTLHASELQQQHEILHHVNAAEVNESDFGGQHPLNARVYDAVQPADPVPIMLATSPTAASRTLAAVTTELAQSGAPQTVVLAEQTRVLSPITEVATPMILMQSDSLPAPAVETMTPVQPPLPLVPTNAALAPVVQERQLQATAQVLSHPSDVVQLPGGSVHDSHASVVTPPHWQELKAHQKELHHVSMKKAQLTPSGGIHTLSKQVVRIVPDAIYSSEQPEAATNSGLARVVQAGHLKTVKLSKVPESALTPSSFGGHHDRNADLEGFIDEAALKQEKSELHHVALEKAAPTLSGGLHTIAQPNTAVVPERVLEGQAPANVALASAVKPKELLQEKRALEHIPVEYQRETMSGGVHMNDRSAALQPSLLDRVKHFVGLDTSVDKTAPELGHVVTKKEIVQHHEERVVRVTNESIAQVAEKPTTHAALAPLISDSMLISQARVMHHVDVKRVELKNDIAAGVGAVTTRRASISRRPSHALVEVDRSLLNPPSQALVVQETAVASVPRPVESQALVVPENMDVVAVAVPSPRLPVVHGRSGSVSSNPSPRQSAVLVAPPQQLMLDSSKDNLPTLFDFEKHTPTMLEQDKAKRFDAFLATEKNVDIPRSSMETQADATIIRLPQ